MNSSSLPAPRPLVPVISRILGVVDTLTEVERGDYFACETVVQGGWQHFVDVGLALAQIRERRLYREEFDTFEEYCQTKWQYGRNYVNRLISAAQVFTFLVTIGHQKPEHERQVRPLIGLTREQTKLVWERALEKSGSRKLTEKIVKSVVRELQLPGLEPRPVSQIRRRKKEEQRKWIQNTIEQLLVLARQKVSHEILTEKLELLHGHIRSLI